MQKKLICMFALLFLLSGCGNSDNSADDVIEIEDSLETQSFIDVISQDETEGENEYNMEYNGKFDLTRGENGKAPTIMLNSGYEMPVLGIGTYSLLDDKCVTSVSTALQNGYRLIDTAYMYHNEESVGEGIRQSGIPREDVFVTTKLYPNQYSYAEDAIDEY